MEARAREPVAGDDWGPLLASLVLARAGGDGAPLEAHGTALEEEVERLLDEGRVEMAAARVLAWEAHVRLLLAAEEEERLAFLGRRVDERVGRRFPELLEPGAIRALASELARR